jgi:hypothetical protein
MRNRQIEGVKGTLLLGCLTLWGRDRVTLIILQMSREKLKKCQDFYKAKKSEIF